VLTHFPESPFWSKKTRLCSLLEWQGAVPPSKWKHGRSEQLLAETWLPAQGFPPSFVTALAQEVTLAGQSLVSAHVEVAVRTPGAGRDSATDIMVLAGSETRRLVIAVEGKVDEGFGLKVAKWKKAGTSVNSSANRRLRLAGICGANSGPGTRGSLGVDPRALDHVPFQLLHRTYSAIEHALLNNVDTAVMAVHSFPPSGVAETGWRDFLAFAETMRPRSPPPRPGVPWSAGNRAGVATWLLWVEDPGGARHRDRRR